MDEIEIKVDGIVFTDAMRKQFLDQLHTVFGYEKLKIKKILINIFEEKDNDVPECLCGIKVYIQNHPVITTEMKTLDIHSAISLAIERAYLKYSRSLSDKKINHSRIKAQTNSKFMNTDGYFN